MVRKTLTTYRPQYQKLLREISAQQVDLVIAADSSRISRDAEECLRFFMLCGINGVKLHLDGKLIDPRKGDERLFTGVIAMVAEYDNWRRRETTRNGRLARLKAGKAVTTPPAGYEWGPDDTWIKDERPGVQDAILASLRAVLEARSLRRAARLLRARGIEIPHRLSGSEIGWSKPLVSRLRHMVHNPAYVGDVAYGRLRSDPLRGRDGRGNWRLSRAPEEDIIWIRDHHEPYWSREEQAEAEALLVRNAFTRNHNVLGPGDAIAQGRLRCGKHRMWSMHTICQGNSADGQKRYIYACNGEIQDGGPPCGLVPHWLVDRCLRRLLIEKLGPQSLEELRTVMEEAEIASRSEERRCRDTLNRLRSEVADLEWRYERVHPEHWAVAARLEQKLEEKRRELLRLEREQASEQPERMVFDGAALHELVAICSDLEGLLDAPTTTPRDRKELLHIMTQHVVMEERTKEYVRLRVVWKDGSPDTIAVGPLPSYAYRTIREMAEQGATPAAIAAEMCRMRVLTKNKNPWTEKRVRKWLSNDRRQKGAVRKEMHSQRTVT
jgi:DNA invertase Pin-like site-specific DNA recombinase